MAATLKQIAQLTGVSVATVSWKNRLSDREKKKPIPQRSSGRGDATTLLIENGWRCHGRGEPRELQLRFPGQRNDYYSPIPQPCDQASKMPSSPYPVG